MPSDEPLSEPSRRQFLLTGGSAVVAGVVASVTPADAAQAQTEAAGAATAAIEGAVPITLRINRRDRSIRIDPRTTLLDCLREALALTGTKKGCDHGQCGACFRVSTLRLCTMATRSPRSRDWLRPKPSHAMQSAFHTHDAYQCGYCTSGQIMSAVALLKEPCGPEDVAADVAPDAAALDG